MAKNGLDKWFKQKWVDIGSRKKDGSGKTPMTPKQKKFAALAPPRNKITYADKIAGATGRTKAMGGGLMEATERLKRQGLRGGGLCKRGMNREAIGKNS